MVAPAFSPTHKESKRAAVWPAATFLYLLDLLHLKQKLRLRAPEKKANIYICIYMLLKMK